MPRLPRPPADATPAPRSIGRRLRFQQLELLSEVADCGTLGEAAERLHLSRAAVSKALKELEHTLGLVLFERSSQGMTPTAAGLRVTRHARLLLHEFRHLTDEVSSLGDSGAGTGLLRLGMPPFVATYVAPGVLQRLRAQPRSRQLVVQLQEGRLGALIEQLLGGELDAVMALFSPRAVDAMDLSMLRIRHFQDAQMVVVGAPSLRLPRARPGWDELLAHPWILPPASTHLRRSLDQLFAAHGHRAPMPGIESTSLAANVQLAVAGLGLAVVPEQAARGELAARRLRLVPLPQPLPETSIALMYRKASAIYMDSIQALDDALSAGD